MSKFGFLATPSSITFTDLDGKTRTVTSSHDNFLKAKDVIKEILLASQRGLDETHIEYCALFGKLENLIAPVKKITESGDVEIKNGVLFYQGQELRSTLTERILWGISEGFPMEPYINFLKNLMENTSHRSVNQLFGFIEAHKMGITEDGYILGYKKIREDYKDIYTGTIDCSPGQLITMPRNKVSDDPNATCSYGLHFCSMSYLGSYGNGPGTKIVIVKVNPKDVVAIPVDHQQAKARCCEYLILSEYTESDKDDLLGSRPVFNTTHFTAPQNEESSDDWHESDAVSGWENSEEISSEDSSSSEWWSSSEESSSEELSETSSSGYVEPTPAPAPDEQAVWAGYLMPNDSEPVSEASEAPVEVSPQFVADDHATNIEELLRGLK